VWHRLHLSSVKWEQVLSGTQVSSSGLDVRRRRALYQAWHRGMREMDILLGKFADAHVGELSDSELDDFENILSAIDRDLFAWLTGEKPLPDDYDTPVMQKLMAFHSHDGPIHV